MDLMSSGIDYSILNLDRAKGRVDELQIAIGEYLKDPKVETMALILTKLTDIPFMSAALHTCTITEIRYILECNDPHTRGVRFYAALINIRLLAVELHGQKHYIDVIWDILHKLKLNNYHTPIDKAVRDNLPEDLLNIDTDLNFLLHTWIK